MALNVLVVDDSSTFRSVVGKALSLADIPLSEIYQAGNGEEALEVLNGNWVDLIFLDINMPVMDGGEFVERIRDDPVLSSIPIVVLTSEGSTPRIDRLKSAGVKAYLRKPCKPRAIQEVVEKIVGKTPCYDRDQAVEKIVPEVIQNFVYLFCDPLDSADVTLPQSPLICAETVFRGDVKGELSIGTTPELCREMAANITGAEATGGEPTGMAEDALGEVVNVVCGHLVTALAGENAEVTPAIAKVTRKEAEGWKELLADSETSAFKAGEELMLVRLSVEKHPG